MCVDTFSARDSIIALLLVLQDQNHQLQVDCMCSVVSSDPGLLLGIEAPIMMPNSVDFSLLFFLSVVTSVLPDPVLPLGSAAGRSVKE